MKCPSCSAENKEGNRFCAMCGSKLQLTCPGCGVHYEPGLNFCGDCGAKLSNSGDGAPAEAHPAEARKAEALVELAGGWVSDFGAAGWGREAFWDSIRGDLGKDIRPREGEEMIFAGRSSLDLHLFLRGFDSSEMTPVAGFMGTNQRMIVLSSKTGSRRLDVLLQVEYKDLMGTEEIRETAARKDMREVDGLLRLSFKGKGEPVDLLVLNRRARTVLLGFLQAASPVAITSPTDFQQPAVQSVAVGKEAEKAQVTVKTDGRAESAAENSYQARFQQGWGAALQKPSQSPDTRRPMINDRIVGFVALVASILVLVAVFTPWTAASAAAVGLSADASAWDLVINAKVLGEEIGREAWACLALSGAVVVVVGSLLALAAPKTKIPWGILVIITGGLLSAASALWALSDVDTGTMLGFSVTYGFGLYLTLAGGIIALVAGLVGLVMLSGFHRGRVSPAS